MILLTRKVRRRIERVNEPITDTSSGWNENTGHYVDLTFKGSDDVEYTIRLVAADVDKIDRLWEAGATHRDELDRELAR